MESISLVDCLLHFRFAARNHWGCSSFIGYIVVVLAPTGHGGCGEFSLCSFLLKNCCWQLVLLVTELSSSSCLLPTFRRAHIYGKNTVALLLLQSQFACRSCCG